MSPLLGIPALALESVRFMALGFPPLSVFIWVMKVPSSWGIPNIWSTDSMRPRHWATPAPLPPPKRPLNQPPTFPATEPRADRALPGRAVTAAKPLLIRPPRAWGQPPNTIFTMPPASAASPLNRPAVRLPPIPSITVLGLWMPKKRLTAPTIGWTTTRLTQLAMFRIAPDMPPRSPPIMSLPSLAQPLTAAAPQAAIWPGSLANHPDRLAQARLRAPVTVETTLDHQLATVRCTEPAIPPMKLRILVNTLVTIRQMAPTVFVMKLRIWVQ